MKKILLTLLCLSSISCFGGGIVNPSLSSSGGSVIGAFILGAPTNTITGNTMQFNAAGFWFDFGTSQDTSQDSQLNFRASPYSSGSGVTMASTGTNPTGGTLYATLNGTNYYYYDKFAASYVVPGEKAPFNDLRGTALTVVNGFPIVLATSFLPGGFAAGNYAAYWFDPATGTTVFPWFTSGKYYPTATVIGGVAGSGGTTNGPDGVRQLMALDQINGRVTFSNDVYQAGSGVFSLAVSSIFDSAVSGSITLGGGGAQVKWANANNSGYSFTLTDNSQNPITMFDTSGLNIKLGGLYTTTRSTAISYQIIPQDSTIFATATGLTVTLPSAITYPNRIYTIKLKASGSCTIATLPNTQTIDASTTYSLSAQYKYVTVQSDGANWNIIANN